MSAGVGADPAVEEFTASSRLTSMTTPSVGSASAAALTTPTVAGASWGESACSCSGVGSVLVVGEGGAAAGAAGEGSERDSACVVWGGGGPPLGSWRILSGSCRGSQEACAWMVGARIR